MKKDDLFDEKVREIFKTSDYSEKGFNKAFNIIEKSNKTHNTLKHLGFVACFSIIGLLLVFTFFNYNKKDVLIANNNENHSNALEDNTVINNNENYKSINISENAKILLSNSFVPKTIQLPNGLNYEDLSSSSQSDYIALVKLDKILCGKNYIEKTNSYVYPFTVSKFTIEKNYKGNLNGEILVGTNTETLLPIDDYVKGGFIEEANRLGYNEMSEDERKNTFIKIPSLYKYTELKEGDYYIAYMNYQKDASLYCIVNYHLFEYNIDTNEIRIPGTDTYEKFELKDYDNVFIKN